MIDQFRLRVHEILAVTREGDRTSRWIDIGIMTLIVLNVLAVILATVDRVEQVFGPLFWAFEVLSVSIFTIEYVLRLWSCTADSRFRHPLRGRLRFAVSFFGIIDLLAILPFYLPAVLPADLRVLRALRLARLFRMLKMARYSKSFSTLANVWRRTKEELTIAAFVAILLLLVASSLMYFAERDAQPQKFSSIPAALWWGVATLTTVGYGDVYPITALGKVLGAMVSVLGIGVIALPAGILGSGFVEEVRRGRQSDRLCPHCGRKLDRNPAEQNKDA